MVSKGDHGREDIPGTNWFCVLSLGKGSELPPAHCSPESFAKWRPIAGQHPVCQHISGKLDMASKVYTIVA